MLRTNERSYDFVWIQFIKHSGTETKLLLQCSRRVVSLHNATHIVNNLRYRKNDAEVQSCDYHL